MDLNMLVKDLEEIKGCIENNHIEKAEDLLDFVIGEIKIAARHSANHMGLKYCPECGDSEFEDICERCGFPH